MLSEVQGTVGELELDNTEAEVTFSITIPTIIDEENEVLNAESLTNMSAQEVDAYLTAFDEIQAIQVEFSPFWVTRTPSLSKNITVDIARTQ